MLMLCLMVLAAAGLWTLAAAGDGFPEPPLREIARERGVLVGVAVATGPFRDTLAAGEPSRFTRVLAEQFSILTAENAMKFGPVSPGPREHDWSLADAMFDFAEQHDMAVRYHTGLWHRQNPGWIDEAAMSAEQLTEIARWHITAIGERYGGRMAYWDVVNEPIDPDAPAGLRDTLWKRAIGPDYLEQVYRWAHAAAPDVKLVLNDYDLLRGGRKADLMYEQARDLLARGVPIHAVGFQAHLLDGKAPDAATITANLQRFADLGLEIHITEMDVATKPLTEADDPLAAQAAIYEQVLRAALAIDGFKVFQVWGLSDHDTWLVKVMKNEDEAPLLIDRQWRAKPAFHAVRRALEAAPRR